MADQPILELKDVYSSYGSIKALKGISLKVYPGEIVAIIGANGAGKSTTLMTTCCVIPIDKGEIWYNGDPIHGKAAEILPEAGLCQVPEGRRIFPRLTVDENLTLGAFFRKDNAAIESDRQHVYKLFPILKDRHKQHGGTLSGGEQQMLAIARALMGRPKVLLLDEPSLGLAPLIVQQIFDIIKDVNKKEGTTILLVEQNARLALKFAGRGYVIENGKIVLQGVSRDLLENPEVKKAYLGG
jgi:branched-chain amino acid transport system ATP-binding protein